MLELESVSGTYGTVKAVHDVSLAMAPGETLALIGRNGAGKTTTLRLVAGVLAPAAGVVRWNGTDVGHMTPEVRVRQGIVLVPEGRGIFPALTVDENLRVGAYSQRLSRKEVEASLDEIYGLVPRVADKRKQFGGSLSGGEQQLVAIGRGLMARPKLLLLDEPSLGLSPLMVSGLYDLLHQLKARGTAFVLVEQYVQLALELCDYAIGLRKGAIAISGSSKDVAYQELADVYMGGHQLEESVKAVISD